MNIFNLGMIEHVKLFHFNPVYYPFTQIIQDKYLIIDTFSAYGLYPEFLRPIFNVIGLNVLKFTIVFSSLTIISFLLAFFFLKNIIKNKIILLCGYLSFLYSFYLQIKLYLFSRYSINYNVFDIDTYFQYVPIRIFFILLVLFLAGFYFKNHNKISYYGCHLLSALAILWNFETGLIVFLAWLLTLIYQELYNHNFKSKIKKIAQHMLISIISFSGIIFLYSFYIYLNTKQFLDPIDFFSTIVLFLNLGLGAILLKFFHPWLILPIIYIIGLLIPIKKIVTQKKANFKTKTVLLVTLIGIGIFSYYQGRSHNYTLYGITYPAIFLLTIWADSLLKYVKRYKLNLSYNVVLFSFIFLFFIWNLFGIYSFLPNLYTFSVKPEKILAQMNTHNQDNRIYKNIEFIQKHSLEREEILIITEDYCESLYYGESKTSCPLNMPDSTSLFYKKDIKKIEDFLINNKTVKVFYNTRNKNKELLYDILKKDYIQASISPNKKLILFIPQSNM
ncbi:hypothetical protein HN415_08230 [Candidatus Woesearchaeota archaeon]|nr:hypothetical protein [Candidatus Woesearchaeota archaeon]